MVKFEFLEYLHSLEKEQIVEKCIKVNQCSAPPITVGHYQDAVLRLNSKYVARINALACRSVTVKLRANEDI